MLGPYYANDDGTISYVGNKLFKPIDNIDSVNFELGDVNKRVADLYVNEIWGHISNINHRINISVHKFFDNMDAKFTLLPLVTKMISSPGAVYGKESIDYTTDTSPIKLKWFDLKNPAFLSESSQIYLELALNKKINHVYSVYNSFRKEEADATHLSEFHHVEYEGKVSYIENERIASKMIGYMINEIIDKNYEDISYFITDDKIAKLRKLANRLIDGTVTRLKFSEALDVLYKATGDPKYRKFTMDGTFGSWEEIKLTQTVGDIVIVSEFPLLEVPFYHAQVDNSNPSVAKNCDFIWPSYREFLGAGHRTRSIKELDEKAKIFNLPEKDYEPYLQSRRLSEYHPTSGFGMGWERFLQGLLQMPFIWSASQFPRVHSTLRL